MKRHPLGYGFAGFVLVGYALVLVLTRTMNEYILSIINFVGIYMILAVSLNITNGFTGLFSLGHPAFMAIGGYAAAILSMPVRKKMMFLREMPEWFQHFQLPFLPSLIIGGVLASFTALVVGVPVLRLRGHYLAVATLGFLIIVQVLITNGDPLTRGPLGLNGLPAYTTLWWVFPVLALTVFTAFKLKFSSLGRSMLAVREDEMAAQCTGVNLFGTRVAALVIGAFFAGLAGGLWAHLVTAITPQSFSLVMAFNIVVMVVVGGTGSITGSLTAAVLFSILAELFRPLEEKLGVYGIGEIVMSLVLLLILVFKPGGMFGSREPGFLTRRA